ncbi:MAG: NAD+ synthase, partial [Actinobacteria bacterium]|nr:NAD+ synthase [Actinomycetota bacterium]NIU67465.1 NAD+ synthase [Actinomycetota bacterium]NIV87915.1 NAD+ synthase [Actinomycetota bacterium]NIW29239.1 NAD+ synthase [Actinomycetota bacterium]NIX21755.1 NAD+ synthase [Actinomycetota bacterium]
DLLLKPDFLAAERDALARLAREGPAGCALVVGHVESHAEAEEPPEQQPVHWDTAVSARNLHNAASVLLDGEVVATYRKLRLPNYGVFDEARYFTAADEPVVVDVHGVRVGVVICEDLWAEQGPAAACAAAGAQVIASPNASPYHRGKRRERERWGLLHARRDGTFLVYVNQVGGQDEVVFDGDSFVAAPDGTVTGRAAFAAEDLALCDLDVADGTATPVTPVAPRPDDVGEVWHALVLATRDYVRKNGFERVWVAVSGGIDSAVVTALAVDALGSDAVTGVALPSAHSSGHSLTDA